MELRSDSKSKKFSLDSDMSLGLKQPSNLSSNSLLKSTSLRNTSVAVNIDSPQVRTSINIQADESDNVFLLLIFVIICWGIMRGDINIT